MKNMRFPSIPKTNIGKIDVSGWSFSRAEVLEAKKHSTLLTLDIDLPGKGSCSLGCDHCFRKHPDFHKEKRLTAEELEIHLREAKELGLKTVKIIGPGEPLEDPNLFEFLDLLKELEITPLIFTKGHPIGNDQIAQKRYNINGEQLAKKLREYGVRVLLGTTSFDSVLEDSLVRKKGYHAEREVAILTLVKHGFNEFIPEKGTKLAFVCAPVLPQNIDEMLEIYKWTKLRNITPIMAPTMIAGRALDKLKHLIPEESELIDLYVKIHLWAIENGIQTQEQLEEDLVGAYAGTIPCNQVAVGMFVRGDGKVLRCPGDDTSIQGNLREQSLAEIWHQSENLRIYSGQYNNFCPPKQGKSFPDNFFNKVLERVINRIKRSF